MNHHVGTDGQFAMADSVMTPNLFANCRTTHHEAGWPTWSLNAFETKVSWGPLQANTRCQVLLNVPHMCAPAYSPAARAVVLPLVYGNGMVQF